MNLIDLVTSPRLLGDYFAGPSHDRWLSVLKAATAQPMTESELALFREVAGDRSPPTQPVRELVCVVGRGGGKTKIAATIATHAAVTFDRTGCLPGELGTVVIIANTKDQAGIAHRYISGFFAKPQFAKLVKEQSADNILLENAAEIVTIANNFRAPRGRRIICAIYDELSTWRSDESASPDVEVDAAVTPGLIRHRGSLKILISSAYRRAGLLYNRYRAAFGQDDPRTLAVLGTSLQFNDTQDADAIAAEIEKDPARFNAEYNSIWRDDLSNYLDQALIAAAVDEGVTVRPHSSRWTYTAAADPSGGVGDSFTAAISHREHDVVVLDAIYEKKPQFNPSEVVAEIAAFLGAYNLSTVVGDRYAARWVTEAFAKEGINYTNSERDRSQIYLDCVPLFTSGRARLLDHQRLVGQFAGLERRTSPLGKDRVGHGPNGHDDVANAAALALVASADDPLEVWRRLVD